jgi:hypothetical protein
MQIVLRSKMRTQSSGKIPVFWDVILCCWARVSHARNLSLQQYHCEKLKSCNGKTIRQLLVFSNNFSPQKYVQKLVSGILGKGEEGCHSFCLLKLFFFFYYY